MGCDIHGIVEVRKHSRWQEVGNLGGLVGRAYDTFGMLWGVRNSVQFNPAFEKRGFPDDKSISLKSRIEDWGGEEHIGAIDFHSPSYATVAELRDVDWEERAEGRDTRYTVLDENKEPTGHKFGWSAGWEDIINDNQEALENGEAVPSEDGGMYIKRMKLTRRRALSGAWEWFIFELLETFADRFGAEDTRLVVWFDN